MRLLIALFLLAHAIAHLVGFAAPWRLSTNLPYRTTLLSGHVDVGNAGIRMIGVLWLFAACAFGIAATGALINASWWPAFTLVTAVASLALCISGWPDSKVGVILNLVILALLALSTRAGWLLA